MHLGLLSDTSWQIVENRHALHAVQLVDALPSRTMWRAVPGSEACPQQWHSAADCKAQLDYHSWVAATATDGDTEGESRTLPH